MVACSGLGACAAILLVCHFPEKISPRLAGYWVKLKLDKPFVTQPGCVFVRASLLAGGVVYGIVLFLVPGPSKWRWLLASTYNTRVLHLLVALRGKGEGVADAAVEMTDHVADEV